MNVIQRSLTATFAKTKIFLMKKLSNGGLMLPPKVMATYRQATAII